MGVGVFVASCCSLVSAASRYTPEQTPEILEYILIPARIKSRSHFLVVWTRGVNPAHDTHVFPFLSFFLLRSPSGYVRLFVRPGCLEKACDYCIPLHDSLHARVTFLILIVVFFPFKPYRRASVIWSFACQLQTQF